MSGWLAVLFLLDGVSALSAPRADGAASATFALVIGVNASLDPDLPSLQYADDDAARYVDLFRALGARTYLLSRLDENTRRLHPQAAAEAIAPRRHELAETVSALGRDMARAHAQGVRAALYVVYAGHGDVRDASPTVTLEDGPLAGRELLGLAAAAGAEESHLIVDACHAYLLAFERGPGGARRPLRGFVALEAAARARNVGYLLASSASGESHEWSGFEAGVFSHEIRSGLYGAADADGDGRVTYAEIAAFVIRANEPVTGERFRPLVVARAPRGGDVLVDLHARRDRALRLEGPETGAHYLLEDASGVRLLDFHGTAGAAIALMRPAVPGPLYLRRLSDGLERTVSPAATSARLDLLPAGPARSHQRGAAQHAFSQLFALPFDASTVVAFRERQAELEVASVREQSRLLSVQADRRSRLLAAAAFGAGTLAAGAGTALMVSAHRLHDGASAQESQRQAIARNDSIARRNTAGIALLSVGAAIAGATVLWLAVRPAHVPVELSLSPEGVHVGARWGF